MDKLIYERGTYTKEAKKIDFEFSDDITCKEFKTICIRMAYALGYNENSIKEHFSDKPVNKQTKKVLKD